MHLRISLKETLVDWYEIAPSEYRGVLVCSLEPVLCSV